MTALTTKITPRILGTSAIGGWNWGGSCPKNDIEAIQTSIDQGVTTIDTAPIYGMGLCEELVGQVIKGRRHEVVIASKCGLRWDSTEGCDPLLQRNRQGNHVITRKNTKPESIIQECEQSLIRLGTDYIDLYQIHWPDTTTPLDASWEAMIKLKKQGKVRAIGVCNYSIEQLAEIHSIHPVESIQLPYSVIRRDIEEKLMPFCIQNKITILVYAPLERGLLTGKISLEHQFPLDDQRASLPIFSVEKRKQVMEALKQLEPIAAKYQAAPAQLILSTLLHKKWITGVIVGARDNLQAIENARSIPLTELEAHKIEQIFK